MTTNQLIVGPRVWAYQVLRQTLGERFMEDFQVRIFVHHFFTNEIALSAPERAWRHCDDFSAARIRFFLRTFVSINFFLATRLVIAITFICKWTTT
jgi:hypothetical protein